MHDDEQEEFYTKMREFGLMGALALDQKRRQALSPSPSISRPESRSIQSTDDSLVLAAELGF